MPRRVESVPDDIRTARDLVRTGDHEAARTLLTRVNPQLTEIVGHPDASKFISILRRTKREEYVLLLRRVTLEAEIAEHNGTYVYAKELLQPFERVVAGSLKSSPNEEKANLAFSERDTDWQTVRQELYFLWQLSVVHYRDGEITASKTVLHNALRLAKMLRPKVEGLLIQLYYGAAKLAFHDGNFSDAIALYGESFQSAERRIVTARKLKTVGPADEAAARYSIGKTFALGLGQCLREEGRFEEAHTVVIAGRLLLELTPDRVLSNHAGLLLGSIERGMAGESNPALLKSARTRLDDAVGVIDSLDSDSWFRAHYELALALMQAGEIASARNDTVTLLKKARALEKKKWIANGQIALSRIERRAGRPEQSVAAARMAEKVAGGAGIERIERRARTTLAMALYDLAVRDGSADFAKLDEAERYLEFALSKLEENDTRNRVMLLLVTAQIRLAKNDFQGAAEPYEEYRKIGYWVQSGRVREIGERVRKELMATIFKAPVDLSNNWNLDVNRKAFEAYMLRRVRRRHPGAKTGVLATTLGLSSKAFRSLEKNVDAERSEKRSPLPMRKPTRSE
jgi:tetratricopeptide (TPR) repeat protein